jgi:hypothetical protein
MAKRILDEATKRRLAGVLPFSPEAFTTWTPEEFFDLPLDLQPKFNIRPFSKETSAALRADIQAGKFDVETARKAIRYAVTSWKDLVDLGNQTDVDYSQEAFDSFPDNLVWIIYKKVNEMTFGISKEEKEALELQPVSESEPLSKAAKNADSTQA